MEDEFYVFIGIFCTTVIHTIFVFKNLIAALTKSVSYLFIFENNGVLHCLP